VEVGRWGRRTLLTVPVLRYMKTYGLSHEQFAMVDGGGALILVAADRAGDFPQSLPLAANRGPVYLLGTGESVETPMVSQMEDFTSSRAFRITGAKAFAEARTTHQEFYCTGLPRRVQRTSSRINIKMAVELSAGKSA
jgi:hypothetical protein